MWSDDFFFSATFLYGHTKRKVRFHSPYSDFMPKGTFLFGSVFILVTKEK